MIVVKKEINTINSTRSSVSYYFDVGELATEKEKVLNEYCSSVVIPGFRKGKAPKNIILSRFGGDIESRVKSILLNQSFEDAQKCEKELNLLTIVDFSTSDENDGLVCKLIYDVRPDIKLPDYKNIKLTSFSSDVTEEEIEAEFNRIKKQHSEYVIVERAVESGDYVKVNYNGILEDGSEIASVVPDHKIWGKQLNTWEEAGNKDVHGVQAVIQGVIGHVVGDKASGQEIFPKDFSIPMLAGKKASYEFEVLEIRERVEPKINEEFLKNYHVATVEELKEKIKKSISGHKHTQGLVKQRDEIVDFLANSTEFELPESVLKHETKILVQMFIDSQVRNGKSIKYLEEHIEEISKSLYPMANKRGKSGLVLDRIAEEENLTVENKDIESMIWQDAMLKRININQYVNDLKKNRELLVDLRTRTLRGKVLDFLVRLNSKEAVEIEQDAQEENEVK